MELKRNTKFSEQDIIDAARALNQAQKPINGSSLRKQIGFGRPDKLFEVYQSLVDQKVISTLNDLSTSKSPTPLPAHAIELKHQLIDTLDICIHRINEAAVISAEKKYTDLIAGASEKRQELEEQLTQLNHDLEAAFNEIEDVKEGRDMLAIENQRLNTLLSEAQDEIQNHEHRTLEMVKQLEILSSSLKKSESDNFLLQSALEDEKREVITLKTLSHERQEQLEQVRKDLANTQQMYDELRVEHARSEADLLHVKKEKKHLEGQLSGALDTLDMRNDELTNERVKSERANAICSELKDQITQLEVSIESATTVSKNEAQRADTAEALLKETTSHYLQIQQAMESLTADLKFQTQRASKAEGKIDVLNENISGLKKSFDDLTKQYLAIQKS